MYVKKTVALRGMFLRSILGTPRAFPFFSFIIFLICRGDAYKEKSLLNTSLYREEQLSWAKANWSEFKVFSWVKENFEAMALAFLDSELHEIYS
jgi:hypothetical protein